MKGEEEGVELLATSPNSLSSISINAAAPIPAEDNAVPTVAAALTRLVKLGLPLTMANTLDAAIPFVSGKLMHIQLCGPLLLFY